MNEINRNHTNHARVVQDHDKPRLNLVELVAFCMSSVSGRFLMFIVGDVLWMVEQIWGEFIQFQGSGPDWLIWWYNLDCKIHDGVRYTKMPSFLQVIAEVTRDLLRLLRLFDLLRGKPLDIIYLASISHPTSALSLQWGVQTLPPPTLFRVSRWAKDLDILQWAPVVIQRFVGFAQWGWEDSGWAFLKKQRPFIKGKWPEKESHQHTLVRFILFRLIAKW